MLIGINHIGRGRLMFRRSSVGLASIKRNPAVSGLLISMLHRRPSDTVGGPSFSASAASTRAITKADFPLGSLSLTLPWMASGPTVTSVTPPSATSCSNWL